jgi:pentatricopeptide repeat protein
VSSCLHFSPWLVAHFPVQMKWTFFVRAYGKTPKPAPKWAPLGYGANELRRINETYGSKPDLLRPTQQEVLQALRKLEAGLKAKQPRLTELKSAWQVIAKKPLSGTQQLLPSLFKAIESSSLLPNEERTAWLRKVAVAIYIRDQHPERSRQDSPFTPTVLVPWIWKRITQKEAQDVSAFWKEAKDAATEHLQNQPLYMPMPLLTALVAAHSHVKSIKLYDFLLDFLPAIKCPSGATHFLDNDKLHPSIPDPFKTDERIAGWMKQVELAIFWSRHGNEGMQGRPRRWADRKQAGPLTRVWHAIQAAYTNPPILWLKLDWHDPLPSVEKAEEVDEPETSREPEPPSETIKQHLENARLTPEIVASFLLSFLRLDMRAEASEVWTWLAKQHLKPTPLLYHHVMLGHGLRGDVEAAEATFDSMDAPKDAYAHGVLARVYLMCHRKEDAMQVMDKIRTDPSMQPVPTTVLNRLFAVMLRKSLGSQAWSMLDSMPMEGPGSPSIYTVNTFLSHALTQLRFSSEDFNRALSLLQKYKVEPDTATYTFLLQSFLQDGKSDEATQLLKQMVASGIQPTERIYASLIHDQVKDTDTPELKSALDLLATMEANQLHPNEYIYSDLVRALSSFPRYQEYSDLFRTQNPQFSHWPDHVARALWLFERARKRAVHINSVSFNSLLQSLFLLDTQESTQEALHLFDQMRQHRHGSKRGPPPDTWYVVLQALVQLDQIEPARQLVQEMQRSGFRTYTGSLQRLVDRIQSATS